MSAADVYINITYTILPKPLMTERDAPAAWFGTRPDTAGAQRKFTTVFYYNNPCNEDVSRLKVISFASFGFVGVVIAQKRPRGRRLFVVP